MLGPLWRYLQLLPCLGDQPLRDLWEDSGLGLAT